MEKYTRSKKKADLSPDRNIKTDKAATEIKNKKLFDLVFKLFKKYKPTRIGKILTK